MVTRRKLLWLSGIAIIVVLAGGAALFWRSNSAEPPTDCQIVRQLIDYNLSEQKVLADKFDSDAGREASIDDYQKWADQLAVYASKISDPNMSEQARGLVDDAHLFVDLITRARSETGSADPLGPPYGTAEYVQLSKQAHGRMEALNSACPAG